MESPTYPDPYTILPRSPHTHKDTLILLHGTSTSGPEFATPLLSTTFTSHPGQAPTTIPLLFPSCKLIFPTGALRPTTVFNGRESNAWFDVHSFADRTIGEDSLAFRRGLRTSVGYLAGLIKAEVEILKKQREGERGKVILWGFSQGAAMAVILLLSGELEKLEILSELGGVIVMSGWLPLRAKFHKIVTAKSLVQSTEEDASKDGRTKAREFLRKYLDLDHDGDGHKDETQVTGDIEFLDTPLLLAHGKADEKVRFEWGSQMMDVLTELGLSIELKSYGNLAHWWTEKEIADIAEFLGKVTGQNGV
jgi:predicted esterase